MTKDDIGRLGENYTAKYLSDRGCEIIARNLRRKVGEVDIIAGDGKYIIFVEVRTRMKGGAITPAESVTQAKQRKVAKAVSLYLMSHPSNMQPRIDVACVITSFDGLKVLSLDYIENAIEAEGIY